MRSSALLWLFFLLLFDALWAQERAILQVDTQYVSVLLLGGKRYVGQVLYSDDDSLVISTAKGQELNIARASVRHMRAVSENHFRRHQRRPADAPTGETYLLNPSAYGPPPGEGYAKNNYIFFYQGHYGITENLSLRAGGLLLPFFVAPQLTVPLVRHRLALGAEGIFGFWMFPFFFFNTVEADRSSTFSLLRSMATVGDRATHLTASMGWASVGKRWAASPVYGLAASWRVHPQLGLVTENYWFEDDGLVRIHLIGGRIYTRALSFDIGLGAMGGAIALWYGLAVHLY